MITLHQEKDEFADFLIDCVEDFIKKKSKPKAIGVSFLETVNQIKIHFNTENALNKDKKSCSQFEYKNEYETTFKKGLPDDHGFIYDMSLWTGTRNATRKINLPSVLCCFEDATKNYLAIESELEFFGRTVVKYFRDDSIEFHNLHLQNFANKSIEDVQEKIPKHWKEALKINHLKSTKFFNGLDASQLDYLNQYVKKIIDHTAFNVMRAIDENTGFDESEINIEIKGTKAVDLPMIGNGNLSGEYLDWIERFSKYDNFKK